MKRLFITFAAMLLMSVSAFAQSNEAPLKGDVNGDGIVDVADITAVIGIIKNVQEHYFYLGTIKPTAENYKVIPGATTSYTSIDETVGTTVSVDAGQMLYMLCPAEWMKGKTVTLEDNSGETLLFSEEVDYTTVSGYAIYKTQVLTDAKDVTLKDILSQTTQSSNYTYTIRCNVAADIYVGKSFEGVQKVSSTSSYTGKGGIGEKIYIVAKTSVTGYSTDEVRKVVTLDCNNKVIAITFARISSE